jgi:hypothetical protein
VEGIVATTATGVAASAILIDEKTEPDDGEEGSAIGATTARKAAAGCGSAT